MVEYARKVDEKRQRTEARTKEIVEKHTRLVNRVRHLVWQAVQRESEKKPVWPIFCSCDKPHPLNLSNKTGEEPVPVHNVELCGKDVMVEEVGCLTKDKDDVFSRKEQVLAALSNLSIVSKEDQKKKKEEQTKDKGKGPFRFPS